MPNATYSFSLTSAEAQPSVERPYVVADGPYMRHKALMAMFNGDGSGVEIVIKKLRITPLMGRVLGASTWQLQRITGLTGGDDIPCERADTDNAVVPAQVLFRLFPETVTGATSMARTLQFQGLNMTRALAVLAGEWVGSGSLNGSLQATFGLRSGGATQTLKLAEGQGFAASWPADAYSGNHFCNIVLRIGSATYYLPFFLPPMRYAKPCFAILNGAGSGVSVEIVSAELQEVGDDSIPVVATEFIDGAEGGFDIAPIKFDSENANESLSL